MKKVALFLAEGFEEIEAIGTVDILRRAGIEVETVSISNDKQVLGAHNVPVIADTTFDKADFSNVEMLVLPGGMPGAKHLNEHEGLKKLLKEFDSRKKPVAAICAAPMVLGGLGILEGKKATCYPGFEAELVGAQITNEKATKDGHVITGKGPAFMFNFALELVESVAGAQVRKEVEEGLLL